jgi:hypothetical protein
MPESRSASGPLSTDWPGVSPLRELGQRAVEAVIAIWPDLTAAELFLRDPRTGVMRAWANPGGGPALLAVAGLQGYAAPGAATRMPAPHPTISLADATTGGGGAMAAPVRIGPALEGFLIARRRATIPVVNFTGRDLDALVTLADAVGEMLPSFLEQVAAPAVRAPEIVVPGGGAGRASGRDTPFRTAVSGPARAGGAASSGGVRVPPAQPPAAAAKPSPAVSLMDWVRRDLASAREVQRNLLPPPLASNSAGARVLAEYLPAFDVGGDFYDTVDLGNGRVVASIGDVSGKGVAAALLMSRFSSELNRLALATGGRPGWMLTALNRTMSVRMRDDTFATVACVLLDTPARRWTVANAGHLVPLLRRRSGQVVDLSVQAGLPIGMGPTAQYQERSYPMEERDILLLATDGVFDLVARPESLQQSQLGKFELVQIIEEAPHDLAAIHREIVSRAESMPSSRDDVALLGIELR